MLGTKAMMILTFSHSLGRRHLFMHTTPACSCISMLLDPGDSQRITRDNGLRQDHLQGEVYMNLTDVGTCNSSEETLFAF